MHPSMYQALIKHKQYSSEQIKSYVLIAVTKSKNIAMTSKMQLSNIKERAEVPQPRGMKYLYTEVLNLIVSIH